jgi:hypothetical protein
VYGADLDRDRLGVLRSFLDRENQLPQILDGIDVVVRRRAQGVGPLGNHAGFADLGVDLLGRQVAADAGLGSLPDLDLDRRREVQVVHVHAEPAAGDLDDHVARIRPEILVQAALAAVGEGADDVRRLGQGQRCVVADRAVAHGRKHDRNFEPQLRRQLRRQADLAVAVAVKFEPVGFAAEVGRQLHRFPQRVDRRVGDLTGVQEHVVPEDRQGLVVAHAREENAARFGLLVDGPDTVGGPVGVGPELQRRRLDADGLRRAKRGATVAAHASLAVGEDLLTFLIIEMDVVGALPHTDLAIDAPRRVALDDEIGLHQPLTHSLSP